MFGPLRRHPPHNCQLQASPHNCQRQAIVGHPQAEQERGRVIVVESGRDEHRAGERL